MISKELISEVLGVKVDSFYNHVAQGMLGYLCNNETFQEEINIYELEHRCKEWASQQDEKYTSFLSGRDTKYDHKPYFAYFPLVLDKDGYEKQFRADTEPEAIFKACDWILDNKDKQ